MTFPCKNQSVRFGPRSGFTLVEILVVIAIIALLAGVALPAITGAIKKAKENAAVQTAHGLALAEFQYSNDNNGVFPGSTTTVTIATSSDAFSKELCPTYVNNTDALYIPSTTCVAKATGYTAGAISSANNAWDMVFITGTTTTNIGLTSNDPDQTPALMTSGSTVTFPAANAAAASLKAAIAAANTTNPFGRDGVAVAYKDMSSAFASATANGGTTAAFGITSGSYVAANAYTKLTP